MCQDQEELDASDADDPTSLEETEACDRLARSARRVANRSVFDVSRLHVRDLWGIMREELTTHRRNGRDHRILFHRGRTYQREPSKEEFLDGAYRDDPWITRVTIHRMKITSQPVDCVRADAKQQRITHGFIDVVYTADGYAFFGVENREGKEFREKQPLLQAFSIDSLRVDALPLDVLRRHIRAVIESKTLG